jgi:transformation/transcription domain-associated protein
MSKLTLRQYVVKVQKWRDRYDSQPDHGRTPRKPLQSISHWLAEFHHNKFEEPIEVPGQYIQVRCNHIGSVDFTNRLFQ